ncbi:unnamed protein product, partial [Prorocentrum cordatum]
RPEGGGREGAIGLASMGGSGALCAGSSAAAGAALAMWPPQAPAATAALKALSPILPGAASATAMVTVGFPFDTVKVRLQLGSHDCARRSPSLLFREFCAEAPALRSPSLELSQEFPQ